MACLWVVGISCMQEGLFEEGMRKAVGYLAL